MKAVVLFHIEDTFTGQERTIPFHDVYFDNLNELTQRSFWISFLCERISKNCRKLEIQTNNINENDNWYDFSGVSEDINKDSQVLKKLFIGSQKTVFIKEFVGADLNKAQETLKTAKEMVENTLNIYLTEENYIKYFNMFISGFAIYQKNIMEDKRINAILKEKKALTAEDIAYMEYFSDYRRFVYNVEAYKFNYSDKFDKFHSCINNLNIGESGKVTLNGKKQIQVMAIKNFFGKPKLYAEQRAYIASLDIDNFIYFESGYQSPDLALIKINNKTYPIYVNSLEAFYILVDNFKGLKNLLEDKLIENLNINLALDETHTNELLQYIYSTNFLSSYTFKSI